MPGRLHLWTKDKVPELTAEAAAGRLAERYDVPELTAGMLDREPTREHGKFLKTAPAGYGLAAQGDYIEPRWLYRGFPGAI